MLMVPVVTMCVCTVQIRSHAQKYFIKVQKLGLAAGLPPQYPRRRFVMQQQGSPAGSSAAAVPILQGQPPVAMPGPSDGVAHGSIDWDFTGIPPTATGKYRMMVPVVTTWRPYVASEYIFVRCAKLGLAGNFTMGEH
jgi:hypothetical protein